MNGLVLHREQIDFKVEPIFKIYEENVRIYELPDLWTILEFYDTTVINKLRDFMPNYNLPSYRLRDVRNMDKESQAKIDQLIKMKAALDMDDLKRVVQTYHMMHVDTEGEFRNLAAKDVW